MNNEKLIYEKFKKMHEQMKLEDLIYNKLEEFKETRSIATAVEICNMIIKGSGLDK